MAASTEANANVERMLNGLVMLGWGVGDIETEAAMHRRRSPRGPVGAGRQVDKYSEHSFPASDPPAH